MESTAPWRRRTIGPPAGGGCAQQRSASNATTNAVSPPQGAQVARARIRRARARSPPRTHPSGGDEALALVDRAGARRRAAEEPLGVARRPRRPARPRAASRRGRGPNTAGANSGHRCALRGAGMRDVAACPGPGPVGGQIDHWWFEQSRAQAGKLGLYGRRAGASRRAEPGNVEAELEGPRWVRVLGPRGRSVTLKWRVLHVLDLARGLAHEFRSILVGEPEPPAGRPRRATARPHGDRKVPSPRHAGGGRGGGSAGCARRGCSGSASARVGRGGLGGRGPRRRPRRKVLAKSGAPIAPRARTRALRMAGRSGPRRRRRKSTGARRRRRDGA